MATLTSHTLNGVDGTHAGGIVVSLTQLETGTVLLEAATDEGGRLSADIPAARIDTSATYELVFKTGAFFNGDDAFLANLLHGLGDDFANFGVGVRRDTTHLGNSL